MADLPDSNGDTGDDAGVRPDREYPGMPRWVKVFGISVIGLILLVVVVLLVATALGLHKPGGPGGHGFGDNPAPTSGQTNTGVGGPANADEAARTVEVTALDNMTFEPSTINVSAGETVTFVVTNTGQAVHEFTLGDATMQQKHADEMAQMSEGMIHNESNSITLQPGETKQLTWRFGDSGTLEYACHEPGHYQAGMRGQITVQ